MMQPALYDEHVFASGRERERAAIGDMDLRCTLKLAGEYGGKIDTLDALKPQAGERKQPAAAAAEELHHVRIARPAAGSEP